MSIWFGFGDKVDYYNMNIVDWFGVFVQVQYEFGFISVFLVYGYLWIEYGYIDYFCCVFNGGEFMFNFFGIDGYQFKGGVNYVIMIGLNVFVNVGWVDKVLVYDGVINDIFGVFVDVGNEIFVFYEVGLCYEILGCMFNVLVNIYYIEWKDCMDIDVNNFSDVVIYLCGMNFEYEGFEVESVWQLFCWLCFDGVVLFGKWCYIKDVIGEVF